MNFKFSAIGIDCFKCVSVNGTNPSCEDPFHNNYTEGTVYTLGQQALNCYTDKNYLDKSC